MIYLVNYTIFSIANPKVTRGYMEYPHVEKPLVNFWHGPLGIFQHANARAPWWNNPVVVIHKHQKHCDGEGNVNGQVSRVNPMLQPCLPNSHVWDIQKNISERITMEFRVSKKPVLRWVWLNWAQQNPMVYCFFHLHFFCAKSTVSRSTNTSPLLHRYVYIYIQYVSQYIL